MADYIKRDSVANLIKLMEYTNGVIECYADEFISDINAIPSADVAEVVRCKDCFYGRIYGNSNSYYCVLTTACHGDDFFCANGARKEGE